MTIHRLKYSIRTLKVINIDSIDTQSKILG